MAHDTQEGRPNPASWEALLMGCPVRNAAATVEERGDGTACITVRKRKPAFLAPPLSWILRPRLRRRYELDRLGMRVWRLCDGQRTVEAIVDEVAAAHRLSFHEARVSVTFYLSQLVQRAAVAMAVQKKNMARKPIDIRKQPRMGFGRTLSLTLNGIRYRLFRSAVTMLVITVAVAFLMNSLSESLIKRSVTERCAERAQQLNLLPLWIARLSQAGSADEILRGLAATERGDAWYEECRGFGAMNEAEAASLHEGARQATRFMGFFDGLDYGTRRLLVHRSTGTLIFDDLQAAAAQQRFRSSLARAKSVRLPTPVADFETFLREWPATRQKAEAILAGRTRAIQTLRESLGDRKLAAALTGMDGEFGRTLRMAGFRFDENTAATVAGQAREFAARRIVEGGAEKPAVKRALAARLDVVPGDVQMNRVWERLRRRDDATWYLQTLAANGVETGLTPEAVVRLAEAKRELEVVQRVPRLAADVGGGWYGLGERMSWLLLVSTIVCMVGIANAMLMSVTERFREIATLKCLGALDGFIMLAFIMEAALLGAVGGVLGGALGVAIGIGRMLGLFGWQIAPTLPVTALILGGLGAAALGVALAAVAAVYPSLKAARLAPMEAMRIE